MENQSTEGKQQRLIIALSTTWNDYMSERIRLTGDKIAPRELEDVITDVLRFTALTIANNAHHLGFDPPTIDYALEWAVANIQTLTKMIDGIRSREAKEEE